MRSITDFRANLVGGGARPNLFRVTGSFPALANISGVANTITYMAEASSVPSDKIGEISVPFMGRQAFYAGDREFDPWTITVINDENFIVRDAFELWMSGVNAHQANTRDPSFASALSYTTDWYIAQLPKVEGQAIKQYVMHGAFPTNLDAMEVDWGTPNTIQKFNVTLRYQWWDAIGSNGPTTDGTAGPLLSF